MAVRTSFTAGEVLAAADLTDTFGAKLNLAGGKILQVVRATDTTNRSTTSTSLVDVTGMAVTITPQRSTSAVIILASFDGQLNSVSGAEIDGRLSLTDSSNNPISGAQSVNFYHSNTTSFLNVPLQLFGYATPATTSPVTFKMRFRAVAANQTVAILNANSTGQMYAIEVSA